MAVAKMPPPSPCKSPPLLEGPEAHLTLLAPPAGAAGAAAGCCAADGTAAAAAVSAAVSSAATGEEQMEGVPEPHGQQPGDACSGGSAAPDIATLVQARLVCWSCCHAWNAAS